MTRKSPNSVDIHIGSRVRARRLLISMSQEKLGEQLGITFQQIQKYEKGSNRIGAGRLQQIADILGVNVGFFYDGAPDTGMGQGNVGMAESPSSNYVIDFLSSVEGIELNKAFVKISDAKVRRKVIELVKSMTAGD